jgi:hypothetical protein
MRSHHHQHPAAGGAGAGERGNGRTQGAQAEFITADSRRLRDAKQAGVDHRSHIFGDDLPSFVARRGAFRHLWRDCRYSLHDFCVVNAHFLFPSKDNVLLQALFISIMTSPRALALSFSQFRVPDIH